MHVCIYTYIYIYIFCKFSISVSDLQNIARGHAPSSRPSCHAMGMLVEIAGVGALCFACLG